MFKVGNGGPAIERSTPAASLPQFTYKWTYSGQNLSAVIVGADPSTSNTTTTIKVGIIPLKLVYGASNCNMTFDPSTTYSGNQTATEMVANSVIFKSLVDYVQGGINIGTTQYEDAYQRANFWGSVQTNTATTIFCSPSRSLLLADPQRHLCRR